MQRGLKGYSDPDMWDLHNYLITNLLHGLYYLHITEQSRTININKPPNWNKILEEMIEGFTLAKEISEGRALKHGSVKSHFSVFNKVRVLTEAEQAKHDKAFKLFNKHFYKLMD